jgi:hypothetical protein
MFELSSRSGREATAEPEVLRAARVRATAQVTSWEAGALDAIMKRCCRRRAGDFVANLAPDPEGNQDHRAPALS